MTDPRDDLLALLKELDRLRLIAQCAATMVQAWQADDPRFHAMPAALETLLLAAGYVGTLDEGEAYARRHPHGPGGSES